MAEALGICWQVADRAHQGAVFDFAEFLTIVAILRVAYNVTNDRDKVRMAIVPVPLLVLLFTSQSLQYSQFSW